MAAQAVPASALLQVPYLAQSELLCGGAAIAMVERWWGKRGVYPEEFSSLIRRDEGGIRTTDLTAATLRRGWHTQTIAGTPEAVIQSLRDSIPVVALIQVGRNRFHYVVIVGWNEAQVVYHDPAVAPFASLPTATFLKRWDGAERWALLVRPLPVTTLPPVHTEPVAIDSLPCRPWLDAAVTAAGEHQLPRADSLLGEAGRSCPGEALVLRELAGVRFRQDRHAEAASLAEAYLERVPGDSLGWQLLASSWYLAGDRDGALAAWNRIGRPIVDIVTVSGSRRIHFAVLADAIGIRSGRVLTAEQLRLANRRLLDVRAVALGTVQYSAVAGGAVEVQAAIVERPLLDPLRRLLVAGVIGAITRREFNLALASPFGLGERWSAQWRWDAAHPRWALRTDLPVNLGLPGIMTVEESSEEFRFAELTPGASIPNQRRRTSTVGFGGWLNSDFEAMSALRYERWDNAEYLAFAGGAAFHSARDRAVFSLQGELAAPMATQTAYRRAKALLNWKPPPGPGRLELAARAGMDWASASAPEGLWPLAGGNLTRAIPLRAHRIVASERLPTERLGRSIVHGGLSIDRTVGAIGLVGIGIGAFVDAASILDRPAGATGEHSYLDAGAGIRVNLPGARLGALRVDLARGLLAEKRWAVSVGVEQPWPPRLRWLP
ncbi:MAG: papain-like cysteine protease family protein [Gemmatimonadales bacterium]